MGRQLLSPCMPSLSFPRHGCFNKATRLFGGSNSKQSHFIFVARKDAFPSAAHQLGSVKAPLVQANMRSEFHKCYSARRGPLSSGHSYKGRRTPQLSLHPNPRHPTVTLVTFHGPFGTRARSGGGWVRSGWMVVWSWLQAHTGRLGDWGGRFGHGCKHMEADAFSNLLHQCPRHAYVFCITRGKTLKNTRFPHKLCLLPLACWKQHNKHRCIQKSQSEIFSLCS